MQAQIYRNLNNGKWSIRQLLDGKWQVIGHCDAALLVNVGVRQSEAARQTVIRTGQRSVHCWAYGTLAAVSGFVPFKGRSVALTDCNTSSVVNGELITYIPYVHSTLIVKSSGIEYSGGAWAAFCVDQKMRASV
jgi:hypothetical protein